jgi:preprotein translocase subunit SecE
MEMAKTNPFEFFQQVRNETAKVTWPSRRETLITTVMVFIFTVCAAVFFLVVDWFIRTGMTTVLGFLR